MREALLALTAPHGEQALVPASAAAEFIADVVEQLGNLDGRTLLISLAQSTGGVWRSTANTNIRVDNLGTTPRMYVPASQHPPRAAPRPAQGWHRVRRPRHRY